MYTANTTLIQKAPDGIIPRTEIVKPEEAENFQTLDREGLLAMEMIEDVKRELRKALRLGLSDKTLLDKTKFKVQSVKSKTIGGAAKLIDWKERLE